MNYMDPYQWNVKLDRLEMALEYFENKLEDVKKFEPNNKEARREALKQKNEAFKDLMIAKHEHQLYLKEIFADTRAREKDAYQVK